MKTIFGVIEDSKAAFIIPAGVIKYKVKFRPGNYAVIFLKYPDRIECRSIERDELGFLVPGNLMSSNKRG